MNKLSIIIIMFPLFGFADKVYDDFMNLKQCGIEERGGFYQALSNDLQNTHIRWQGDEWGGMFVSTNGNGFVSNVEYYVDFATMATNVVSTNLVQVSQNLHNGEIRRYTYAKSGRISLIELVLSRQGDFKCYEVDTNEDLECYYSMTNFVGEHGLMMYRNGRLTEVGGVPDFSIFKE